MALGEKFEVWGLKKKEGFSERRKLGFRATVLAGNLGCKKVESNISEGFT